MSDIDEFTVSAGGITVLCVASPGTGRWSYICLDPTPAGGRCHTVVGFDDAAQVAGGAAGHLRWHADGKRECNRCGSTLGPDDPRSGRCRDRKACEAHR